jgi:hypothetical protein
MGWQKSKYCVLGGLGITQKKAYDSQNMAKVLNERYIPFS